MGRHRRSEAASIIHCAKRGRAEGAAGRGGGQLRWLQWLKKHRTAAAGEISENQGSTLAGFCSTTTPQQPPPHTAGRTNPTIKHSDRMHMCLVVYLNLQNQWRLCREWRLGCARTASHWATSASAPPLGTPRSCKTPQREHKTQTWSVLQNRGGEIFAYSSFGSQT